MKHKSDDYKTVTVKYYLNNNNSMDEVCKIFKCKKSTLKDWVNKYKITKNLTRKNRNPISYKINKEQVKTAVNMIDKNEQITMDEHKDELRLIHGLLRCKSGCGSWNRDRNGSSNIYKIARNAINNIERPSYLCRETRE